MTASSPHARRAADDREPDEPDDGAHELTKAQLTYRIKRCHRNGILNALECGRLLTIAKARMRWGEYEEWVDKELPFSIPTAQLYKRVWDRLQIVPDEQDVILNMSLNEADEHLKYATSGDWGAGESRKRRFNRAGWSLKKVTGHPPDANDDVDQEPVKKDLIYWAQGLAERLALIEEKYDRKARQGMWSRVISYVNGEYDLAIIPDDGLDDE